MPMKKNETLNSTQSKMALLSKDLRMNIFSRLPSKSVGKSKCVCKEWRAIISDPFFKSLHRERSSLKPDVLLLQIRCLLPLSNNTFKTLIDMSSVDFDGNLNFDYTFTVSASVFEFMPSMGELICFVSNKGIHVCNPSTREFVNLPKTNPVFGAAFGYIKGSNEYVLLCFDGYKRCQVMRWRTDDCCLTDRSWKVVDAKCPYSFSFNAVLVDKCFFWIECVRKKHDELLIVSFDLEKEEFGMLVPPEDPKGKILVELKGMLCLADVFVKRSTMDIWVLKDFKNCIWVKEYTIDLSTSNIGGAVSWNTILYHVEGKFLMDVNSKSLEWYDVENKCVKRIHNHNEISQGWCWSGLYTDGLFSLRSL